ncbi:MAG: hypothetical protein IPM13_07080 [Phycisphaerales bacterium]|nr:hypothetical protein [Phycisphaerales bacterium]
MCRRCVLWLAVFGGLTVLAGPAVAESLHFTYLWHLEQPIYWPDRQVGPPDRYERAWQSIQRKDANPAAHPLNNLREIFGLADRVAAYQHRPKDCVGAIAWTAEGGAQVSYSGGLIENIWSLGEASQLGYAANWTTHWRTARGWTTSGGKPRMDMVVFPFHHALLPLCDDSAVRKQIQLYKRAYADAWGATPPMSKGFFPSEMAFSERLIPILAAEGIEWCVVSSEKISRAVSNFPVVLGTGGINCDPPNKADQLNPPQDHWFRLHIDRGCSPAAAYPYAYQPRYMRYVDPGTGAESHIVAVPACQALGWKDGYSPLGLSYFATLSQHNPAARPMLVLLAHDGDNAWGGGYSYYMEAVPNFVSQAAAAGYVATTVQQYLADHPPPLDDIVHVEDGAWVNADGDFGSPQMLNWNWPPVTAGGQVDIAGGWAEDIRNWAVIVAAQNRVDTAEQIAGGVDVARVLYPGQSTTPVERAWHYFMGALNSGYMYYGTALDMEVKPTIACNLAVSYADQVIGSGAQDATPPTIWIPQRHPWNPGGLNFGPVYGYQQHVNNGDFWVWTFVYDVSGVQSVTLKLRLDDDGVVTDANRTYAGGAGVGAWQSLPMTARDFPAGNVYNDPTIDFFVMPTCIARQYTAQVTGVRSKLVDYYVEAIDTRGYLRRSPIQRVWVGDGQGAGGGSVVTITPNPALAGQPVTIRYNPSGRPLAQATQVCLHYGFNQWNPVINPDPAMTWNSAESVWQVTVTVSPSATQLDCVFNDCSGTWDNNSGQDWHFPVQGGQPADVWDIDGQLDADATLVAENGVLRLYAGLKGTTLYLAAPDAGEGNDHFIFVACPPGSLRAAPWAKAGQVAGWAAFIGNENSNLWCGWFDAQGATQVAAGGGSGWLEGTLDLAGEFGALPESVWLAFGPYASPDGGGLIAFAQVPPSVNGDGNVDAAEYVEFPLTTAPRRGDTNCDGVIDFDDIDPFVLALAGQAAYAAQYPDCTWLSADADCDGAVDFDDIDAFVACLSGPCDCP